MCGIAGVLVFEGSNFEVSQGYIARMRDAMAHRGPDGYGCWIDKRRQIGLGHRRLSIIDLSEAANQPMANEDGSLQIVFNGEIYNHAEIRKELQALGRHRWRTDHSDTEALLQAFEEWGIGCLSRLRGMFAVAIWDDRKQELWLARDRIGIKPLYYAIHHQRLCFASEIKGLLTDADLPRNMDEDALYSYLSFLTTPSPTTLFQGIRKVPPATWIRISAAGQIQEQRYWDVWENALALESESETEIAERLLAELRTSVRLRKISDVPVGVFLSGGIDSSTNVALFSESEGASVKTFSIGYKGAYPSYPSELPYARMVASRFRTDHHELELTMDDLISFLPRMVALQDEPIADPVCVPVFFVSQLARDHGVVVCQVGEGSDELFWGYPGWKTSLDLQVAGDRVPGPIKRAGLGVLGGLGFGHSMKYEWLRRSAEGQQIFWGGAEAFTEAMKRSLLSDRMLRQIGPATSWEVLAPIRARFEERAQDRSHLNWMSYLDLNLRLPELLLMRVDKMSMGVGLEARVPFLDHKFVELAMRIPVEVKTRNRELKHILKVAVNGLIPSEIISRKKQGFGVPVYEWMFDSLGELARREVREFVAETDIFKAEAVDSVMEGKSPAVWYLLNLAMWWKHYIKGSACLSAR